jgi:hypothetical protein
VAWAWMRGYELSVAAQQEWPGPGPREGDSDMETHLLVQELIPGGRGAAEVRRGAVLVLVPVPATRRLLLQQSSTVQMLMFGRCTVSVLTRAPAGCCNRESSYMWVQSPSQMV